MDNRTARMARRRRFEATTWSFCRCHTDDVCGFHEWEHAEGDECDKSATLYVVCFKHLYSDGIVGQFEWDCLWDEAYEFADSN